MDELHKEIINIQRNFRDRLDDRNHPNARELDSLIQRVEDEIQVKKNPRSIEDNIKRVIQQLSNADGKGFMNNRDLDDLKDRFEDMRRQIQRLM